MCITIYPQRHGCILRARMSVAALTFYTGCAGARAPCWDTLRQTVSSQSVCAPTQDALSAGITHCFNGAWTSATACPCAPYRLRHQAACTPGAPHAARTYRLQCSRERVTCTSALPRVQNTDSWGMSGIYACATCRHYELQHLTGWDAHPHPGAPCALPSMRPIETVHGRACAFAGARTDTYPSACSPCTSVHTCVPLALPPRDPQHASMHGRACIVKRIPSTTAFDRVAHIGTRVASATAYVARQGVHCACTPSTPWMAVLTAYVAADVHTPGLCMPCPLCQPAEHVSGHLRPHAARLVTH